MTVTGTGADGVKLLVHAQTESELITARFDDVVLADGEQDTVTATTARGAPGLTLTSSQGTIKPTILARTARSAPPPLRRVKARRRGAYVYITVRGSTRSAYLQLQRGRTRGLVARRTVATPAARTITVRVGAPGARYVKAAALDDQGRPSATRLTHISR